MKGNLKRLYLLLALVGSSLSAFPRAEAQTFTTVYSFSARDNNGLNSDGGEPSAGLLMSGSTLFGTASVGGANAGGTIFAVGPEGTSFTNLHDFMPSTTPWGGVNGTNFDGAFPAANLILSSDTLYGTAIYGGTNTCGTIFKISTDGSGFTVLHTFPAIPMNNGVNQGGALPYSPLILSGNTLYGTTSEGGPHGAGTVYSINADGTGFTNLYNFSSASDGSLPVAGLLLSGNTLYGTAMTGGANGNGTVFSLGTDGSGFTNLHSFGAMAAPYYQGGTNSDGGFPIAGLVLNSNTLYGAAQFGGAGGAGTLFKINTDGTGFSNLYSFSADNVPGYDEYFRSNSDGGNPGSTLILSGNTLYGTAVNGGSAGFGTIFAINTDGSAFTNLHSFSGTASGGSAPNGNLILSGLSLYGTTMESGYFTAIQYWAQGDGTIFRLSFAPQLTITPVGTNVLLSWPTNVAGFDYTGFTLQSSTGFGSSTNWSVVSSAQGVIGGQCVVTNPMPATQMFYRLSR